MVHSARCREADFNAKELGLVCGGDQAGLEKAVKRGSILQGHRRRQQCLFPAEFPARAEPLPKPSQRDNGIRNPADSVRAA